MKIIKAFAIVSLFLLLMSGCSTDETTPNLPPSISGVTVLPDSISTADTVKISAEITDEDGNIENVDLHYHGVNIIDSTISMTLESNNVYSAEIGPFADSVTVNYEIRATDDDGETTVHSSAFTIGTSQPQEKDLYINEFMSHNDLAYPGEFNDYPDWIEIYNAGEEAVDIGGMYMTDKLDELTKSQIPTTNPDSTTIQPDGFLILIADGLANPGILHLDFKLSDNEDFALVNIDGVTIVDQHNTDAVPTDMSEGRVPDGSDNWQILDPSTPGSSNNP